VLTAPRPFFLGALDEEARGLPFTSGTGTIGGAAVRALLVAAGAPAAVDSMSTVESAIVESARVVMSSPAAVVPSSRSSFISPPCQSNKFANKQRHGYISLLR